MRRLIVLGLLSMPALAWSAPAAPADSIMCVAPGLQPFCGLGAPAATAPSPLARADASIFSPYIDLLRGISRAITSVMVQPSSTATVQRTSM